MHAPPPFPFWPLSPNGPASHAGVKFDDKELASLDSLKQALNARGLEYTMIRSTAPASLLLDLSNAGKYHLLREVVNDWGVVYALWKTSDAYMEARGERRRQLRQLSKYLFSWAGEDNAQAWWPLRLIVHLGMFQREMGKEDVRRRLTRSESMVLQLKPVLENMTRELAICSKGNRFPLRDPITILIGQSESTLQEASLYDARSLPSQRLDLDTDARREEAHRAEKMITRLTNLIERSLEYLQIVIHHASPLDAHRARHAMRQGAGALLDLLPEFESQPRNSPAIMLFDGFLYVGRLLVGIGLLPLVMVTQRLSPQHRAEARSGESLAG